MIVPCLNFLGDGDKSAPVLTIFWKCLDGVFLKGLLDLIGLEGEVEFRRRSLIGLRGSPGSRRLKGSLKGDNAGFWWWSMVADCVDCCWSRDGLEVITFSVGSPAGANSSVVGRALGANGTSNLCLLLLAMDFESITSDHSYRFDSEEGVGCCWMISKFHFWLNVSAVVLWILIENSSIFFTSGAPNKHRDKDSDGLSQALLLLWSFRRKISIGCIFRPVCKLRLAQEGNSSLIGGSLQNTWNIRAR